MAYYLALREAKISFLNIFQGYVNCVNKPLKWYQGTKRFEGPQYKPCKTIVHQYVCSAFRQYLYAIFFLNVYQIHLCMLHFIFIVPFCHFQLYTSISHAKWVVWCQLANGSFCSCLLLLELAQHGRSITLKLTQVESWLNACGCLVW